MEILLGYPEEIIRQIFSYIPASEIEQLEDDPLLGPYYLVSKHWDFREKHKRIKVRDNFPSSSPVFFKSLLLQPFLDLNPTFQPKDLEVHTVRALDEIPSETLAKFANVYFEGYPGVEDLLRISKIGNLRGLGLSMEANERNVDHDILKRVTRLRLFSQRWSSELPPSIIDLSITGVEIPSFHILPSFLQKLSLSKVKVDFEIPLPGTLLELELDDKLGMSHIDLSYLSELRSFNFQGSIDRFALPISITQLTCKQLPSDVLSDLSHFRKLEKLTLKHCRRSELKLASPSSLLELTCRFCEIQDLTIFESCSQLREIDLDVCEFEKTELLDIVYPSSLIRLRFDALRFYKGSAENKDLYLVKLSNLPSCLEVLKICSLHCDNYSSRHESIIVLDSHIVWPDSLKSILISGIDGFHDPESPFSDREYKIVEEYESEMKIKRDLTDQRPIQKSYTFLNGPVWPLGLESLSIEYLFSVLFMNTNLEDLKRLQSLVLNTKVRLLDTSAGNEKRSLMPSRMHPISTSACLKTLYLTNTSVWLTDKWFCSFPKLEKLSLIASSVKIPEQVAIPRSIRELTFSSCELSSNDLNNLRISRKLDKLDLSETFMEPFDISNLVANVKILGLYAEFKASDLPHWDIICETYPPLRNNDWEILITVQIEDIVTVYPFETEDESVTVYLFATKLIMVLPDLKTVEQELVRR